MDFLTFARRQWDRVGAWLLIGLGALVLLLGWIGVSGTGYAAEQLPYIVSGGLVGIFLVGIGGTLWLSADLRDEWRKLDQIEQVLREVRDRPTADAYPTGAPARAPRRATAKASAR